MLKNIFFMNPTISRKLMHMLNLIRDPVLYTVLKKDNAVQTDNVNSKGINEEVDQP